MEGGIKVATVNKNKIKKNPNEKDCDSVFGVFVVVVFKEKKKKQRKEEKKTSPGAVFFDVISFAPRTRR